MFDQNDQDSVTQQNDFVYKNINNQMQSKGFRNDNGFTDNRNRDQARYDFYVKYKEKELAKNDPEYQGYLRQVEKQQIVRMEEN